MKLHHKLVISLVAVLLFVAAIGQLLQYRKTTDLISKFSESNIQILREREEKFAKNIHESIEQAVAGSLERGEMEKFTKILKAQKKVEGLIEFSLYDRQGTVTHSVDAAYLGKQLSEENMDRLMKNHELMLVWGEESIEIYHPQIVNNDCIRCHISWVEGEVGGITNLRLSTAALDMAKAQASDTIADITQSSILNSFVSVAGILLAFSLAMYFLVRRLVSRPLESSVEMLKDIAEGEGDLTRRLKVDSNDEVGWLAKWFNIFITKLQTIFKNVAEDVTQLASASTELSEISNKMKQGIGDVADNLGAVASATKEVDTNMSSVASAVEQTSSNVNKVSLSTEEMTNTIREIAANTDKARSVTGEAVEQAKITSERVYDLGKAAQDINKVTETIAEISAQTNLLALNATIEAARAGEAGKGFAVVANEVKMLARQTSEATEEIKKSIQGIQNSTGMTTEEIDMISKVITDINEMISNVATAAEEQSITTKEIAESIAQAANGIGDVTESVKQSSQFVNDIARDVDIVNGSATDLLNNSSQVNTNAYNLEELAKKMNEIFGKFKV